MPAPRRAVPDPPRRTTRSPSRQRRTDAVLERDAHHPRSAFQTAIAAPANAASARSTPRSRPARAARASATCSAARRRDSSRSPATLERPAVARRVNPADEWHPALARRTADPQRRARAATDGRARLAPRVRRQRDGDGAGRVPPAAKEAAGTDDHHRPACATSVSSQRDDKRLRWPGGRRGASYWPLDDAVAADGDSCPDRPSRRVPAGAPRRPRIGAARHLRHPGLDP